MNRHAPDTDEPFAGQDTVECPRCHRRIPTRDGVWPMSHGRPAPGGGVEPCRDE